MMTFALGLFIAYQAAAPTIRTELLWFDRTGKQDGTVGNLGDYGNLELSPDGKQVAVTLLDPKTGSHDIWIYDTTTGQRKQFTSTDEDENWLVWSPDGQKVIFNRFDDDGYKLYEAPANGNGPEELLYTNDNEIYPMSWSPDGQYVLFVTNSPDTENDIWALPLSGDKTPMGLFATEYEEAWAAFSPNGKWIAFSSTFGGDADVYISPFPANNQVLKVSEHGGTEARWRHDGKELFFLDPGGQVMSASIDDSGADINVGSAKALFQTHPPDDSFYAFAPSPDGQRILVNTVIIAPNTPTNIAKR